MKKIVYIFLTILIGCNYEQPQKKIIIEHDRLKTVGYSLDGLKTGEWLYYNSKGSLYKKEFFNRDSLISRELCFNYQFSRNNDTIVAGEAYTVNVIGNDKAYFKTLRLKTKNNVPKVFLGKNILPLNPKEDVLVSLKLKTDSNITYNNKEPYSIVIKVVIPLTEDKDSIFIMRNNYHILNKI